MVPPVQPQPAPTTPTLSGDLAAPEIPATEAPAAAAAAVEDPFREVPPPDDSWDAKCEDLLSFRRRFGHCYVPEPWPEQPALGIWVRTQREKRAGNTLTPEHLARLDAIGFHWTGGWEVLGPDWLQKKKEVLGIFYHDPDKPAEHFPIEHLPKFYFDDDDLD